MLFERYDDVFGTRVLDLKLSTKYPNDATVTEFLENFELSGKGDTYGGRMRGYITPKVTGDYTFYISGDDSGELRMGNGSSSTGTNRIAFFNNRTAEVVYITRWA